MTGLWVGFRQAHPCSASSDTGQDDTRSTRLHFSAPQKSDHRRSSVTPSTAMTFARMREGNVFTGVYLWKGKGTPWSQVPSLVSGDLSFRGGGLPRGPLTGPDQGPVWWGGGGRYPRPQSCHWSYLGVPAGQDRNTPVSYYRGTPGQDSSTSTSPVRGVSAYYLAGGMPLAVKQEEFLVP